MKTLKRLSLPLALVAAFFACAKKEAPPPPEPTPVPVVAIPTRAPEPARIARITVVKAIQPDKSPGEAATTFGKKDTVYVSFWVEDAPAGTELKARWTDPKGNLLTEDKIVTDKAGSGYSEFHAAKKSGWAPGTYTVEILMNGQSAGSTTFTIS